MDGWDWLKVVGRVRALLVLINTIRRGGGIRHVKANVLFFSILFYSFPHYLTTMTAKTGCHVKFLSAVDIFPENNTVLHVL